MFYSRRDGNIGHDPVADTAFNHWVTAQQTGSSAYVVGQEIGTLHENPYKKTSTRWEKNDMTLGGGINTHIMMTSEGASNSNLLIGNTAGKFTVTEADIYVPDGRDLNLAAKTFQIFHEGNKPSIQDVVGGVEEAPKDGTSYVRKSGGWALESPFPEAPQDGKSYVRRNAKWEVNQVSPLRGTNLITNDNGFINNSGRTMANAKVGEYVESAWQKISDTEKAQVIFDGNFVHNHYYLLTHQTSHDHVVMKAPASGHWKLVLPINKWAYELRRITDYQAGDKPSGTVHEPRNISEVMTMSSRYYDRQDVTYTGLMFNNDMRHTFSYESPMYGTPEVNVETWVLDQDNRDPSKDVSNKVLGHKTSKSFELSIDDALGSHTPQQIYIYNSRVVFEATLKLP